MINLPSAAAAAAIDVNWIIDEYERLRALGYSKVVVSAVLRFWCRRTYEYERLRAMNRDTIDEIVCAIMMRQNGPPDDCGADDAGVRAAVLTDFICALLEGRGEKWYREFCWGFYKS